MADIAWPEKTRDMHSHHFDSTMWDGFEFRDDDIVIATYAKAGTTWVQQILAQLLFDARTDLPVAEMSPWVDIRVPPKEVKMPMIAAQEHRRFLKTHLPVDALVFSPKAKYLYIARDGRDVVWSMYNHHAKANDLWYEALNDTPGRVGPPIERPPESVHRYYRDWFENDGDPWWPFWENMRTWWEIRGLPNVMMLHFAELKADMAGQIRRIADFIDVEIDEEIFPKILEHCSFDYMKTNGSASTPMGGAFWVGGAETFINQGTNGRWTDTLSEEEINEYDDRAVAELGEECAQWLGMR